MTVKSFSRSGKDSDRAGRAPEVRDPKKGISVSSEETTGSASEDQAPSASEAEESRHLTDAASPQRAVPARAEERSKRQGPRTPAGKAAQYAVETHGLTKVYRGRVQALKAVDIKVPAGSAFGLLGPNGAGKSTLVKTLLSIVHPTAGAATLFGQDISLPQARVGVGYLPEGHRFPQYLTGRGVLEYFGQLGGLQGQKLEEEIEQKLALVGMSDWASTRITRYSKGMLQRVGLAQAMLGNPRLVILDEPTDGVDPIGRHQMREVIQSLCRTGTTVFLNSHLLLEVEQICDHVAIMHHGRVVKQGPIDEVRSTVRNNRGLLEVRFATGPVSPECRARLETLGPLRDGEGGAMVLSLDDDSQISSAIDMLRQDGVAIFAVEPARVNLEQAFIALIDAQEDQGVGGTRA